MFRISLGLAILLFWFVLIIFADVLAPNPQEIDLHRILQLPSISTWQGVLGYDDLGRSIVERIIEGAKTSLLVAFVVAGISLLTGTLLGVCAAYFGGLWDHILVRLIDIFMAFPGILLAIALSALMGPGISNVIIALSIVSWVAYARLSRAQVLSIKTKEHVLAAKALGQTHAIIMFKHILPLIFSPLLVEFTFAIAGLVIAEAGLSFLGLGIQPPGSSWGNMIKNGSQYLLIAPHMVIVPGLALMSLIFAVNLLGDQIRSHFVKG